MSLYLLPVALIVLLQETHCLENATGSQGCSSDPACLKCGPAGCIKCLNMITHPSRKCVDACPYAHEEQWSTVTDYMGRICVRNRNFLGLPQETLAVLTGILTGAFLCLVIVSCAVFYIKYKQKVMENTVETNSDADDSPERRDFVKQVETLRPFAEYFLGMLNDTRKQVRELHQRGDSCATSAYKPVLRDLAKLLIILNRPIENTAVPDDWDRIYNWAEKNLKRCKRISEVSQPQVAQLVTFLQGPVTPNEADINSSRGSATMSTFKPDQSFGSSLSLQDVAVKNFNSNYDSTFHTPLNPQWKFDYALMSPNPVSSSQFDTNLWKNSKEYLNNPYFLDDDFCQLGFRPQDEITTEL